MEYYPQHKMTRLKTSPHQLAVIQALFVAFLWSTSWVLIKIGLAGIPPLTFAGLRYFLAFLCLLVWYYRSNGLNKLKSLTRTNWMFLGLLGIMLYTFTQGALFFGLAYLPSATVNLLLSFTSIVVACFGIIFLKELPTLFQWLGVALSVSGALVYFSPLQLPHAQVFSFIVVILGMLTNSAASILGRRVNKQGDLSPMLITLVSLGIGGTLLLLTGVATQGLPAIDLTGWLIILWLAGVNTAFAFTLYNLTLRTLPVVESCIITNTMIIQIPILAIIFLGEMLVTKQIVGLSCVAVGTVLVQLRKKSQ